LLRHGSARHGRCVTSEWSLLALTPIMEERILLGKTEIEQALWAVVGRRPRPSR
jgi:hypothetical protein